MKSIGIFVEGGGATARSGQDSLRQGFDALLGAQKEAARKKRLRWQLGLYGSRNEAFDAFCDATAKKQVDLTVLLVDSEGSVLDSAPNGRVAHLAKEDGWEFEDVDASQVHLMTQCMEAWIVADPTSWKSSTARVSGRTPYRSDRCSTRSRRPTCIPRSMQPPQTRRRAATERSGTPARS